MPRFFDIKSGILYGEGQCPNENEEGIEKLSDKDERLAALDNLLSFLNRLLSLLPQNLEENQKIVEQEIPVILNELKLEVEKLIMKELSPGELRRSNAFNGNNLQQFFSTKTKEIIQGTFDLNDDSNRDLILVKP